MINISILIPVYNVRPFITKSLESVAAQTYSGQMECIIVDDRGNDGSIELAENFIAKYDGPILFHIIHHDCNRGLAAARNTAVTASCGEFVFHLDSDDWLEPTAIELLVKRQHEINADIVSGSAIRHRNSGGDILVEPDYATPMDMVHKTIEMTLDHVIWRRLIRKSLYMDNNISAVEGVNIGEDHHTLPRLAYYANRIAKIDDVVYHYNCMNPDSYMSMKVKGFNLKRFKNDVSSINILYNFFRDKDTYCVNRLSDIKQSYICSSLYRCCCLKDKSSFQYIKQENVISQSYYLTRLKVLYNRLKILLYNVKCKII